jgi:hypothetical protein
MQPADNAALEQTYSAMARVIGRANLAECKIDENSSIPPAR